MPLAPILLSRPSQIHSIAGQRPVFIPTGRRPDLQRVRTVGLARPQNGPPESKKTTANMLKAVLAMRYRFGQTCPLNSIQYFAIYLGFFCVHAPDPQVQVIKAPKTSSGSEEVSPKKHRSRPVGTKHPLSCRHDNASKRENRGKHLQNLKMFSITRRRDDRNIGHKPFQHLAMQASRSHPMSMILLKPLPILGLCHTSQSACIILGRTGRWDDMSSRRKSSGFRGSRGLWQPPKGQTNPHALRQSLQLLRRF